MNEFNDASSCPFLEIPCADCPVQSEYHDLYEDSKRVAAMLQAGAGSLVGPEGEEFDESVDHFLGDTEKADAIKSSFRQEVSRTIDQQEQELNEIEEFSRGLSDTCDGVLRMRASKKGATYIVSICTSSLYFQDGPEQTMHTSVQRSHIYLPKE